MALTNGFTMYNDVQAQSLEKLVELHAPLVKRIAHHLVARLPSSVQVEDLIQSGMIGLFEAAKKYDAGKGASFETYAGIRIRGAMLDEVRKGDWVPRSVHRNARRVSEAISHVEHRTGRDAKDHEVAQELGVALDEYYAILQDTAGSRMFSFDSLLDPDEVISESGGASPSPLEGIAREALQESLAEAIHLLPQREQLVLSLYYDEELNLKEIGEILGVSESRVSQIHSQTALRLRARLQAWWDKEAPE